MKTILNIFASIILVASSSAGVVSCSSSQKISTDQSLYNQLQGKTFTIQDNKFWGNEAEYQQDLLKDIEKLANISSQDVHLLSADGITPFLQPSEKNNVPIIIDNKLKANVNVIWKLTPEQSPLYHFYQVWPKISQKIGDENNGSYISLYNGCNHGPLDWWNPKAKSEKYGWDMKQVTNYSSLELNGNILKSMLEKSIELEAGEKYSDVITNYLYVSPNIKMNLGKDSPLKLNDLMFKNGDASFPLNYIKQEENSLNHSIPWTINYSNDYYLVQKKLQKYGQTHTIHIGHTYCEKGKDGKYHASDEQNRQVIDQALNELGFSNIVDKLTFSGIIKQGGVSDISVSYKDVDQGFKIPILMG